MLTHYQTDRYRLLWNLLDSTELEMYKVKNITLEKVLLDPIFMILKCELTAALDLPPGPAY